MKKHLYPDHELKNKYNSQREYNKRNYRPEKSTYGAISSSDCLRYIAEKR